MNSGRPHCCGWIRNGGWICGERGPHFAGLQVLAFEGVVEMKKRRREERSLSIDEREREVVTADWEICNLLTTLGGLCTCFFPKTISFSLGHGLHFLVLTIDPGKGRW